MGTHPIFESDFDCLTEKMSRIALKYREQCRFGSFYTGAKSGDSAVCGTSARLFLICDNGVKVLDQKTGQVIYTLEIESDAISAICLSPDGQFLVVASKLGFLRQYTLTSFELVRTWRAAHAGPVRILAFDSSSTFVASGGPDGTVKVWDVIRKFCTHNFTNHTGLIQALYFHGLSLFVSCDDNSVKRWSLHTSAVTEQFSSHVSTVTAMVVHENMLYTAGRDSVVLAWDLKKTSNKRFHQHDDPRATYPAYEPLESIVFQNGHLFTAGQRGTVRKWALDGAEKEPEMGRRSKTPNAPDLESYHSLMVNGDGLVAIDNNHNIHFLSDDLERASTLNGNLEEVLDTCVVNLNEKIHIVAATTSPIIQMRALDHGHSMLLEGHNAAVLSVDSNQTSVVSAGRDQTVRLWLYTEGRYSCAGVGTGHTDAVTCVRFNPNNDLIYSCSEDRTLKCWQLVEGKLTCLWTKVDHEKCVNSLTVSPNGRYVCSASNDKTMCLYDGDSGNRISIFEGHRKGVWTCAFSPVDQILASGSADGDIRLWNIKDGICVKSLEGTDGSVLSVAWSSKGDAIVSTGSDGVMRVWDLAKTECTEAIEAHEDRCWSLTRLNTTDQSMVTSGADGQVVVWADISVEIYEEEREKMMQKAADLQTMANLVQTKQFGKALKMALRLGHPGQALDTVVMLSEKELESVVGELSNKHKVKLMEFCAYWNRNSKTATAAQRTLKGIFVTTPLQQLLDDFSTPKNVELLLPFTDRYRRRIDNLRIQSRFSNFLLESIKPAVKMEELGGSVEGPLSDEEVEEEMMEQV